MIRAALASAVARLSPISESARLDAELLLAHLLGWNRAQLRSRDDEPLSAQVTAQYDRLIERRASGEPVAYLVGYRDFWKSRFAVGPGVLVPRPETELLVETALEWLSLTPNPQILDLGAGTGAIGLSLALERPDADVDLVDASSQALAIADLNRTHLGVARARLFRGSWFAPVAGGRYHLILSNPPYIAPDDPHLATLQLSHEPLEALAAADAGLADLRHIVSLAPAHLHPGGRLLLEHGYDQGPPVRTMLAEAGFGRIHTYRDLSGMERATGGGLGD